MGIYFFSRVVFLGVMLVSGISATQPKHTLSTPESSAKGINFSEKFSSIAKALFYNSQQKVHQPSSWMHEKPCPKPGGSGKKRNPIKRKISH